MTNETLLECSKRLKQCREENNFTLEDVGSKIGVHKSTVLRWENGEVGKIKTPIMKELADLYNVNVVWLMGYEAPKELYDKKILIDVTGLSDDDIDYLKMQIQYLKRKNQKSDKS